MRAGFTLYQYDKDGDIWDNSLLIHLEDSVILKLKNKKDLSELIKHLKQIEKELTNNYDL